MTLDLMRNPTWCRRVAAEVGPTCTQVIAEFMEVNAIHRLRSAQGVLALRKTVGDARLEAASARASQWATRATAPPRASSPPAPNLTAPPNRRYRRPQRICADPEHSTPTPVRPREPHIVSVCQPTSFD